MDRYQQANTRRRKDDRNRRILEMWKAGSTETQISAALHEAGEGITRQRVHTILKRELQQAQDSRLDHAALILEGELERLNTIIRYNWVIMTSPCRACRGTGEVSSLIPGVPDPAPIMCEACRGDGKSNHPDVRVRASKAAMDAIDRRVRMLGGYEPDRLIIQNPDGSRLDFRRELENLSGDELDRMVADYQAGVEAGIKLAELHK